ncbi:MAG: polyprenyl synthetase family protein [Candidatus Cloacimonetes bacterium]|nr:polyprenyl synthetase family protein [Candidatus Cloacimonadota bacterium]
MKNRMLFKRDLKEKNELVNIALDRFLPRKDEYPKQIHKAMRHTLFAGGKRIRPYLMIRTYNLFSEKTEKITEVAAALELMHTYTLIHDDLPDIDNDDIRRGKPTCHVVYGADLALLAGDALLVNSIELLNMVDLEDTLKLKIIKEFVAVCGDQGLIAGQMADIINEGKKGNPKVLEFIHLNKTVKLFQLCTRIACFVAKAGEEDFQRLDRYGYLFGMAFQIIDDILDIEGEESSLGKTTGKDMESQKVTYPAVYGLEKSKIEAQRMIDEANEILSQYGEKALHLHLLNNYIISREI